MELTKYELHQIQCANLFSESLGSIILEYYDYGTFETIKIMIKTLHPMVARTVVRDVLVRRDQEFPAVTYQVIDCQVVTSHK